MAKRQALDGIKVAEFAWAGVGPLTGKYLSDHGATVIRVESHTSIDPVRNVSPYKDGIPGVDRGYWFPSYNTNKYGISLDINIPKGQEIARKLMIWADVVTEAYTPNTMKKWGLDYSTIRELNPDVIYLSTCQQGQYGPHSLIRGYGMLAASIAGFYNLIGWADRSPGLAYSPYSDYINPRFGAATILAALDYRRRTGKGQYIDQSQFETTLHFIAPTLMHYIENGQITIRDGNRNPYAAPHGVFISSDERWVAIAVTSEEEWVYFCKVINNCDLAYDPRFATLKARKENEEELERLVGTWTKEHTADEIERTLQIAGVPAGIVNNMKDLFEDPQLLERKHFQWLPHDVIGTVACESPAFTLSDTPCQLRRAGPCLGEHNEFIYKKILGLSDDEIAEMLIEHVITTEDDIPGFSPHG